VRGWIRRQVNKMDCEGCVYYRYESDTGFSYCVNEDREKEEAKGLPDDGCKYYYAIADAKADAKNDRRDFY